MKLPEDLKRSAGGEKIDRTAQEAIRLAYRTLERFPEVVRRHKFIAGGAAVSSALVALAGVAVARRMHDGASADDAVDGVTEEELNGVRIVAETEAVEVTDDAPTNGVGPVEGGETADAAEDIAARP